MIPWASPRAQYRAHKEAIEAAIGRVLASGNYVLGEEVDRFERAFAAYCGVEHAIGVGNGTDALILAMRALGIGRGDEVVTVSHTALATVAAVLATGATPVLVDVDPATCTIDPARIEGSIGPRTRAIVAVHLYGRPVDLDAIEAIAKQHGLCLIEDCAQAAGARHRDRCVGSIGDVASFSFYPTKNLGAIGDGGMVTTANAALAERVRRLRQYGWNEARETKDVGVNSRLDPLQAAILGVKLSHLDVDNARRAKIAQRYARGFAGLPLNLPEAADSASHVYHLYVLGSDDRDGLAAHLAKQGVGSAVHYPVPVHRHRGYAERVRIPEAGLPATDRLVGRILSLPIYPELGDAEVDQVIAAVRNFFEVQ
jgi:dTDP-4-amino-4,6-dideoxygalactose transaminase